MALEIQFFFLHIETTKANLQGITVYDDFLRHAVLILFFYFEFDSSYNDDSENLMLVFFFILLYIFKDKDKTFEESLSVTLTIFFPPCSSTFLLQHH